MRYEEFREDPRGVISKLVDRTLSQAANRSGGIKIIDEVAAEIGKSDNQVKQYAYLNSFDQNIKLFELPGLLEKTKEFIILHELAEMFGFKLINREAWELMKVAVNKADCVP